MNKEDLIRLALPASIFCLAASILMMPMLSNAFPNEITVMQAWGDSWEIDSK